MFSSKHGTVPKQFFFGARFFWKLTGVEKRRGGRNERIQNQTHGQSMLKWSQVGGCGGEEGREEG